MWRQEDVYYALGGGIDALTSERVTSPHAASDKIDASAPGGLVSLPIPPLMHGAGQFSIFRATCEGNTAVIVDKFDAEEVWRLVGKHKINMIGVTGDAMARPLADALEQMKGEVDLSSLFSFSSTAAIFSQTVKEQLAELLPDGLVMSDAIGSTESGMNGIRLVQKGDAPKEGITTVIASADTVVLDENLNPLEPGTGVVGRLARGGNIPLGYYNDPEKTAATFVTDTHGRRWSIPGDYALLEADGRITLLGRGSVSINSGGEKIYPEEVEGALKSHPDVFDSLVLGVPDDRLGQRVAALIQLRPGAAEDAAALQAHVRGQLAGYKAPRTVWFVDSVGRTVSGKADYGWAREYVEAHDPAKAAQ
jgi:acyl-CoA synthetase (AMP-forming)/AMP-acid ligase II